MNLLNNWLVRIKESCSKFTQLFAKYWVLLKWLGPDSLWRFKWLVAGIIATGFLGVATQVAAVGQGLYYAKMLKSGETVKLLSWSFYPRESVLFLAGVAASVLLMLLFSAFLIYLSRAWIIKLGIRYDAFCSKRLILLFGASPCFTKGMESSADLTREAMIKSASGDARFCNRIIRISAGGIVAGVTCICAAVPLFYLDYQCTLIILALLFVAVAFLYRINIKGAVHSIRCEKNALGARKERAEILKTLCGTVVPYDSYEESLNEPFEGGVIRKDLESYRGRLIAVEHSTLLSNILLAVGTTMIMLFVGYRSIHQNEGWGELVVYLVALRYFLVNLRKLSRTFTSVNRFFPQLRRYYLLMKSLLPSQKDVSDRASYEVRTVEAAAFVENACVSSIKRGDCVGVVTQDALDRYSLPGIVAGIFHDDLDCAVEVVNSSWFATSSWGYMNAPLRKCLGLPSGCSVQEIRVEAKNMGLMNVLNPYLARLDLDAMLSEKEWSAIDDNAKFALSLISGVFAKSSWVFLDERGLNNLPEDVLTHLVRRFSDRILVIIFSEKLSKVGGYMEGLLIVLQDYALVGLGDLAWFEGARDEIESLQAKASLRDQSDGGYDVDSEIDDMDFEE